MTATSRAPIEVTERLALDASLIDGLGHVNQAAYHGLLGTARQRLLMLAFAGTDRPDGTFAVARVELDYHREVRLADGYVDVRARIAHLGSKSVRVENDVRLPDGSLAARGIAVMVAWDREGRGSRLLTDNERAVYGA